MNFRATASSHRILTLAILAVIFHALMPLWMAVPTQTGVRMEMCSTLGAKSVFVKFDTGGKGAPDKDLQARCPLCLAGAHLALTPPATPAFSLPTSLQHVLARAPRARAGKRGHWPPYLSRAPPVA